MDITTCNTEEPQQKYHTGTVSNLFIAGVVGLRGGRGELGSGSCPLGGEVPFESFFR